MRHAHEDYNSKWKGDRHWFILASLNKDWYFNCLQRIERFYHNNTSWCEVTINSVY